jgi:hypothetical protein
VGSHKYSKHQYQDTTNYRIRDETSDKWVTNGVGRQVRQYGPETDDIIEELKERTKGCDEHDS